MAVQLCYAYQQWVQFDGTNADDVQTLAALCYANSRVASGNPDALEIYSDFMPTRTVEIGAVVVSPDLAVYPTLELFQNHYKTLAG